MSDTRHIYAGIVVDVVEENLERVSKLLAGIPDGTYRAVGSALKRAGDSAKTEVKSAVSREYHISSSEFLAQTRNINHFVQSEKGMEVVIGFAGHVIPLMNFRTQISRDGRVSVSVKRNSAGKALDNAFMAQVGGHRGIFERKGENRFPIQELFGPATPQMMYSNEDVMDAAEEKLVDTFNKRIDHEISRILNGWGVK